MTPLLLLTAAHVYHVAPTGDDAADGIKAPWRTLARASKEPYAPGDTLVLTGTLEGHLELTRPVKVRGGATILSKDAPAITVRTGDVEIRNLVLKGGATAKKEGHEGILLAAPKGRRSSHVRIENVDVSGFGGPGISIAAEKGSPDGFDDLQISKAKIHGVYGTGIISDASVAFDSGGKTFAHHRFLITDCDTSDNFDGAGIILSGVDGATVQFCRSADNRSDGGGLGMWAWCARNVTFRYDIAHGIRSKGDGGGYDLDGGTVGCVVEHCLSYDNVGPGGMYCDFPSAPRTHGNVFRDNVSIDDGRKAKGDSIGFGYVVWGSGLYDCVIECNLVVVTKPNPKNVENGGLFAAFIRDDKTDLANQRLEGALFRDNVIQIGADGEAFVRDNFPATVKKEIAYRGNAYLGAAGFVAGLDSAIKSDPSIENWRKGHPEDAKPAKPVVLGNYRSLAPRESSGLVQAHRSITPWLDRPGRVCPGPSWSGHPL